MRIIYTLIFSAFAVSCGVQPAETLDSLSAGLNFKAGTLNYDVPLDSLFHSLHLDKKKASLFVDKSNYTLSVRVDTVVVKTYPVVFGYNPVDDKLMEGDRCTPEGVFKVRAFYPHKSWSKFIWFDYPNATSWKKHNQAKKDGLIPKNARIGGEVGIHGVPEDSDFAIDEKQNWTWGCVSLKRKDIDEIYRFAFVGMKVEIIH